MATSKYVAETIDKLDEKLRQAIDIYGEGMSEAIELGAGPDRVLRAKHCATMTKLGRVLGEMSKLLEPF